MIRGLGIYLSRISEVKEGGQWGLQVRLDGLKPNVRGNVNWGVNSRATGSQALPKRYSHIHRQLEAKRPFGRVFVRDEVDPSRNETIAFCSPRPLCATRDFHVIGDGTRGLEEWYNPEELKGLLAALGKEMLRPGRGSWRRTSWTCRCQPTAL